MWYYTVVMPPQPPTSKSRVVVVNQCIVRDVECFNSCLNARRRRVYKLQTCTVVNKLIGLTNL